jgi:hypothetical protein
MALEQDVKLTFECVVWRRLGRAPREYYRRRGSPFHGTLALNSIDTAIKAIERAKGNNRRIDGGDHALGENLDS